VHAAIHAAGNASLGSCMSASSASQMTSSDASSILLAIYFNVWSLNSGFFTCGRKTWRGGSFVRRSNGIGRLEVAEGFEAGQGEGDFGFVVGISEVRGISAMEFTRNVLVLYLGLVRCSKKACR